MISILIWGGWHNEIKSDLGSSWLESHRCTQPDLGPNLADRLVEEDHAFSSLLGQSWSGGSQINSLIKPLSLNFMPQNRKLWREKWRFRRHLLKKKLIREAKNCSYTASSRKSKYCSYIKKIAGVLVPTKIKTDHPHYLSSNIIEVIRSVLNFFYDKISEALKSIKKY